MLEQYERDLHRCAVCHDQCLFATAEVFATGRQTFATSRKAMLVEAVRQGALAWTPELIEVVYAGLSSGVQHAVCVWEGDPLGWPDETDFLRAARVEITRSDLAPAWAEHYRDRWRTSGNPYGLRDQDLPRGGPLIMLFDAATRAFQPDVQHVWMRIVDHLAQGAGFLATGSTGFELFDLGFEDEAREAATRMHHQLTELQPGFLISDSPEAMYMIGNIWPRWGLTLPATTSHVSTWLAEQLDRQDIRLPMAPTRHAYHDPGYLAR
jgi:hypothetical protein